MWGTSHRSRSLLVGTIALLAGITSCLPCVQRVSHPGHVPDLTPYSVENDRLLVITAWSDRDCNLRDVVVLDGSDVGRLADLLPERKVLGWCGIDGHGPSHYHSLAGVLTIASSGRAFWSGDYLYDRSKDPVEVTPEIIAELIEGLESWRIERTEDSLWEDVCRSRRLQVRLSPKERLLAVEFLRGLR